jgi:hypothetical protein
MVDEYTRNGWGASIADGLSTAILMEMPDVVLAQLNHIATIDFSHTKTTDDVSLFETTVISPRFIILKNISVVLRPIG